MLKIKHEEGITNGFLILGNQKRLGSSIYHMKASEEKGKFVFRELEREQESWSKRRKFRWAAVRHNWGGADLGPC